jgi:hypothetical protein
MYSAHESEEHSMRTYEITEEIAHHHKKESSVYVKFAYITAAAAVVTAAVGGVPYLILEVFMR